MDEQDNSGGEQQAEQQEQQQQHAAQDGSAGATTEYESVEVPLYDVSWRARHRREWKRPCRVCADEARAARRAAPRSSFPSTRATRPSSTSTSPKQQQPWEDLPPLVAIEKYCTSDNALQRLSWAGVSGRAAEGWRESL